MLLLCGHLAKGAPLFFVVFSAFTTIPLVTAVTTEKPAITAITTETPYTSAITTEALATTAITTSTEVLATTAITTEATATTAITTEATGTTAITTEAPDTTAITTEATGTTAITTEATGTTAITTEATATTAITTETPATTAITTEAPATTAITTEATATTAITTEAPATATQATTAITTEAPTTTEINTETPTTTEINTETPTTTVINTETPTTTEINTETPTSAAIMTEAPTTTDINTEEPTTTVINSETPATTEMNTETPTTTAIMTEAPTSTTIMTEAPTTAKEPATVTTARRIIPYELVLGLPFQPEYSNRTTIEFMNLADTFRTAIFPIYINQPGYVDIRLIRFVPGSTVARFATIFNTTRSEADSIITQRAQEQLRELINNGALDTALNITNGNALRLAIFTDEEIQQILDDPSFCTLECGDGSYCHLSEKYPGRVISECVCEENRYEAGDGGCQIIPANTTHIVSALTGVLVVLAILFVIAIIAIGFLVVKLRRMSGKIALTDDVIGTEYATVGGGSSPVAPPRRRTKRTAPRHSYTPATSIGTAGQQAGIVNSGVVPKDTAPTRYSKNIEEESPYQALNPDTMEATTYTSLGEGNQRPKNESTYTSLSAEQAKDASLYQNVGRSDETAPEALEMAEYQDHVYLDL
ncbi:PREDICTED: mucin-3A-like [Branchiostoma belcheri]|uniref:Mucin-3A-like n=1 Tax=Branchiostoma belcheri TaxID=7741 RepID=A0A6P4Z457_BRABE|nr:PREDICTED: mucin-3A-like [Branchiostoma belcheri]